MSGTNGAAISVAIADANEVVVSGVLAMLKPYEDRLHASVLARDGAPAKPVDIVMCDSAGGDGAASVDEQRAHAHARKLVVYSWDLYPDLSQAWLSRGASGVVDKRLGAEDLVVTLERINAGERLVRIGEPLRGTVGERPWRRGDGGLTEREAGIVAMVSRGLSNKQIAEQSYLSINTVKSYIRAAYRKMGVSSRSHAILWAIDHGLSRYTGETAGDEG